MVGAIYALMALGIVMIYKATKVFNFAQAWMIILGAYFFWSFLVMLDLPWPLSLLLALLLSVFLGWAIERLAMRPLIGQPILAPIILTLALLGLFRGLSFFVWGGTDKVYPEGLIPVGAWRVGGIAISQAHFMAFALSMLLILLLVLYFRYTRSGLAMRVTAEDHTVAQSLGIQVKQVFSTTWVIAGAIALSGGVFLGGILPINQELEPVGLMSLAVVLLGGLESIPGAVIAGLVIGVIQALSGYYLSAYAGGGISDVMPFVVMLLVLLIKPYGLFGLVKIERL